MNTKRIVVCALLLLMLVAVASSVTQARPGYCKAALDQCVAECKQLYSGLWPWELAQRTGCITGCNIGYLGCVWF